MHNFIALTNGITKHRSDANEIVDMMARRPNVSSNDDANGVYSKELKQIRNSHLSQMRYRLSSNPQSSGSAETSAGLSRQTGAADRE